MKRLHKKRANVYVIATVIVLLAYIAVIVMLGCLIGLFANRCVASLLIDSGYERDDFETVVCLVAYGDTAWDYADRYCPEGLDKREYLEWCAKENGLDGIMGDIHYGRSYVFLKLK